jgi:hypothetical protein
MKLTAALNTIALSLIASISLASYSFASPPASPAPTSSASIIAKCTNPSIGSYRLLLRQAVVDDLKSKGHTPRSVVVIVKSANSPRTKITLSNIANLQKVGLKADSSGYELTTAGDLSIGCVTQADVTIKGSYIPAGATDSSSVKTFASTQKVNVLGAFN